MTHDAVRTVSCAEQSGYIQPTSEEQQLPVESDDHADESTLWTHLVQAPTGRTVLYIRHRLLCCTVKG